jgi:hypothetical protein
MYNEEEARKSENIMQSCRLREDYFVSEESPEDGIDVVDVLVGMYVDL